MRLAQSTVFATSVNRGAVHIISITHHDLPRALLTNAAKHFNEVFTTFHATPIILR